MKLKTIHWILIAVLLVEIIAFGAWFFISGNFTPRATELLLNYTANNDGSFSLLSLMNNIEEPEISFTYKNKEYKYEAPLVTVVDAYRTLEKYQEIEKGATEELWAEFKNAVSAIAYRNTNKQHASLEYIRNVAKSGYNVQHDQLYDNNGVYTINTTTTLNNWSKVFKDYIVKDDDGNIVNELAMGATIKIGDNSYNAIVYTMVHSDGDSKNNSTAPEVTVHILFGNSLINDIPFSEATIYYLTPGGSAYFAHSDVKLTYTASGNEARYRDLLILGGAQ